MISIIAVGINNWQKYTLPLIKSWQEHASEVSELTIVDNGSKAPYPMEQFYPEWGGKIRTIHSWQEVLPYPRAINWGLTAASGPWYIILNNDCLIEGPIDEILGWNKHTLYANEILMWKFHGLRVPYPRGWMYVLHENVIDEVGTWDPDYKHAIADDLDYGWRCWKAGIPVDACNLPIKHLEQEHYPGRGEAMKENRALFARKHGFSRIDSGGG